MNHRIEARLSKHNSREARHRANAKCQRRERNKAARQTRKMQRGRR